MRVVPIAPHANAYNKVEGTVNSLVGHAAANAIRANLGDAAWSIMEEGAAYQHNCRLAPTQVGRKPMSRMEALTGRRPDVSAMRVRREAWLGSRLLRQS